MNMSFKGLYGYLAGFLAVGHGIVALSYIGALGASMTVVGLCFNLGFLVGAYVESEKLMNEENDNILDNLK